MRRKHEKRRRMADDKLKLIKNCINYLDNKSGEVTKEIAELSEKMVALQAEAIKLKGEGVNKAVLDKLKGDYTRAKIKCELKQKACEGFRSVLFALYDLEALIDYLHTREWFSHFKALPDRELADDIMNENGQFAAVAARINDLYEYLLECMENELADAREYGNVKAEIKKAADYRKKLFDDMADCESEDDDWMTEDAKAEKKEDKREEFVQVDPVPNVPVNKVKRNKA